VATTTTITVLEMVEGGIPLAAAVRAELAKRGLSQGEWCEIVGHSTTSLSRLFSDESVRYDDLRDSLCRSFNLDRDWLDEQLG